MNTALLCLLCVGLLPMICAGISKSKLDYDNKNPRAWLARQSGFRLRANSAQQNSWEAFLWFAVAILAVHSSDKVKITEVEVMAIFYVVLRIFYIAAYVSDFAMLRTVFWSIAFILNIIILVKAIV
ncbi:MAG: MAPEG family protein [Burkholderiaceae bacterium]